MKTLYKIVSRIAIVALLAIPIIPMVASAMTPVTHHAIVQIADNTLEGVGGCGSSSGCWK